MGMKLRIPALVTLVIACTAALPAADPQLLNLVMPDAKVLAGVNVDQAKVSPFGQYLIAQFQAQDQHLRDFIAKTGFDPTRDLSELVIASTGSQNHAPALTAARGIFSTDKINAAAQSAGAVSEVYKGVTIVEEPRKPGGYAFLNSTLAIAGDVASVKGAIDRQTAPAPLPAALLVKVNQLSVANDAWAISEIPPPEIKIPGNGGNAPSVPASVFQAIQQASGGVKLSTQGVSLAGELQADTAANAKQISDILQFFVNLGQMQAQKNPQAASLLKSLVVASSGNLVQISMNLPEAEAESLFQLKPKPKAAQPAAPRQRRSQ
ncbi:MAG: hypothetical protein C5B51_16390 [Terriglobia bacterium]|nr:MAG: hypothetical protein C5B51_16390 [Terriglobia bacterium]